MRTIRIHMLCMLVLAWSVMAYSANVIWDSSSIYYGGDTSHFSMTQPALGYEPGEYWSLHLALSVSQLDTYQYQVTGERPNLLFSGNWVKPINDHAIADESTTRHLSEYIIHQFIDAPAYEDSFSTSSFVVTAGDEFYLMFCVDTDYPNLEVIYGWVQLRMEDDGTISYLHSAYDLDGGPMVVGGGVWEGGIPEPSGGILFLLGLAALGLRRRTSRPIML